MKKKILALLTVGLMLVITFSVISVNADNAGKQATRYNLKVELQFGCYSGPHMEPKHTFSKDERVDFLAMVYNKGPDTCYESSVSVYVMRVFPKFEKITVVDDWAGFSIESGLSYGIGGDFRTDYTEPYPEPGLYIGWATVSSDHDTNPFDDVSVYIFRIKF